MWDFLIIMCRTLLRRYGSVTLLLLLLHFSVQSQAAQLLNLDLRNELEAAQIPTQPSAPPKLAPLTRPNIPQCERYFLYQGQRMECDSNVSRDANRLRPILEQVPESLDELNRYQERQKNLLSSAYFGSVGLLAMLIGAALRNHVDETGGIRLSGVILIGGLVITGNSIVYAFSMNKANEIHLQNSVKTFNQAKPEQPIVLEFSSPINF